MCFSRLMNPHLIGPNEIINNNINGPFEINVKIFTTKEVALISGYKSPSLSIVKMLSPIKHTALKHAYYFLTIASNRPEIKSSYRIENQNPNNALVQDRHDLNTQSP